MADVETPVAAPIAAKKPAKKPTARKPKAAKSAAKESVAKVKSGFKLFGSPVAKAKFGKALDEARAGVATLGKEAQSRAGALQGQLTEKFADRSSELLDEARALGDSAKVRAAELAQDGKLKASEALGGMGKIVADNAGVIDDKLGAQYGDYARTAAKSFTSAAARLEAKDLSELGDDAKKFVRKSPALAIGIAAVAGFMLSRMFSGGTGGDGDD